MRVSPAALSLRAQIGLLAIPRLTLDLTSNDTPGFSRLRPHRNRPFPLLGRRKPFFANALYLFWRYYFCSHLADLKHSTCPKLLIAVQITSMLHSLLQNFCTVRLLLPQNFFFYPCPTILPLQCQMYPKQQKRSSNLSRYWHKLLAGQYGRDVERIKKKHLIDIAN